MKWPLSQAGVADRLGKDVKGGRRGGRRDIYMTQAFEPVFRETFQKKFSRIKVTTVVGRGFQLGQRIMASGAAKSISPICALPAM